MYKGKIVILTLATSILAWGNPLDTENPFAVDKNIKKIEQEENALLQALKKEQESMGDEDEIFSDSNASVDTPDTETSPPEEAKKPEEAKSEEEDKAESDRMLQIKKEQEQEAERDRQFALAEKQRKESENKALDKLRKEQEQIRKQRIIDAEKEKAGQIVAASAAVAVEKNRSAEKGAEASDTKTVKPKVLPEKENQELQEAIKSVQDEENPRPAKTEKASQKKKQAKKKRHSKKRKSRKKRKHKKIKKQENETSVAQKAIEEEKTVDTPEHIEQPAKKHKTAEEVLQEAIRGTDG